LLQSGDETLKTLATVTVAGVMLAGMLSAASAADVRAQPRGVVVAAPAPVVVQRAPLYPHAHAVLWCVGGLVVSAVVHNPVPAVVGCTIGAVHLVHGGIY
jgi:hypothetical protein